MQIPVFDPKPELDLIWNDLDIAIKSVFNSGRFIMGAEVKQLEDSMTAYFGVNHAVALNSGTDALVIGLRALGITPGDEVITTPFSFFATAEAISAVGAKPIFVDIDPTTFNIDASCIEKHISPKTNAIIPVHLYGHASEMDAIMRLAKEHSLKVLEDVAQAFGGRHREHKLGTIGDVGAFSFFPTKNLGAYGDAGLLITNDDSVAEIARMLRTHGSKEKYKNELVGYNSRMDTLQAAILNVKLPYIDINNDNRRKVAKIYNTLLERVEEVVTPIEFSGTYHVYHQYTIRIRGGKRDLIKARLADAGISSMIYYPVPIHRLPVYKDLKFNLPNAELASSEVLSLPIWPGIEKNIQSQVVDALLKAL